MTHQESRGEQAARFLVGLLALAAIVGALLLPNSLAPAGVIISGLVLGFHARPWPLIFLALVAPTLVALPWALAVPPERRLFLFITAAAGLLAFISAVVGLIARYFRMKQAHKTHSAAHRDGIAHS